MATKCPHCKDGKAPCDRCSGRGEVGSIFKKMTCPKCKGGTTQDCLPCGGSGYKDDDHRGEGRHKKPKRWSW